MITLFKRRIGVQLQAVGFGYSFKLSDLGAASNCRNWVQLQAAGIGCSFKLPDLGAASSCRIGVQLQAAQRMIMDLPVISSGWGRPMMSSMVGPISASTPPVLSSLHSG